MASKKPPRGHAQSVEAIFHKKVKGNLNPGQQRLVMNAFRDAMAFMEAELMSNPKEETP